MAGIKRIATYNPCEVDIIYGPLLLDGFAEGEFITVDQDEDTFSRVVGSNGEACDSLNANDSTTVTVKLMGTSKSNPRLSALHTLDIQTGGRSPQALLIKDRSGNTLWATPNARIWKPGALSFDKQAKMVEWPIKTGGQPPTNLIGGN
jgi:hypothetical protein